MKNGEKQFSFIRARALLWVALGVCIFIGAWWALAAAADNSIIFPSPWECFGDLWQTLCSGQFWRSFWGSFLRSTIGFAVSVVAAVLFGYLGKVCKPIKLVLAPVVGILRSLPTMSVILLFVLWLGGELTPLMVSGLVIFPTLYGGLDASLCSIPPELEETAKLYAGKRWYTVTRVYAPLSAKPFVKIMGGGASLSLKLTVAAEVLAQTRNSLGLIMQETKIYFEMGRLVAVTAITVVASLIIELVFYIIYRIIERIF